MTLSRVVQVVPGGHCKSRYCRWLLWSLLLSASALGDTWLRDAWKRRKMQFVKTIHQTSPSQNPFQCSFISIAKKRNATNEGFSSHNPPKYFPLQRNWWLPKYGKVYKHSTYSKDIVASYLPKCKDMIMLHEAWEGEKCNLSKP